MGQTPHAVSREICSQPQYGTKIRRPVRWCELFRGLHEIYPGFGHPCDADGTSRGRHDLSGLDVPLRSHGGMSEQKVPLLVNRSVARRTDAHRWRNFDAFDLGLNLVARP